MFIMVGAWHDTEKTYSGNDYATLKARMIDTLSESAVAIFITSFTDISSFAIGCLTDIIAVRGFCAMTSACLFFTFLYQLTFFASMMVIIGKMQIVGRNACIPCLHAIDYIDDDNDDNDDKMNKVGTKHILEKLENMKYFDNNYNDTFTTTTNHKSYHNDNACIKMLSDKTKISKKSYKVTSRMKLFFRNFIIIIIVIIIIIIIVIVTNIIITIIIIIIIIIINRNTYVPILLDNRTKFIVLLLFIIYLSLSIYGIMGMEQGLDYDKLLIKTDPIVRTIAIELELFHGGDQIDIAVVKAPDMTKPLNRKRVEQMVHDFEHMIFATGPKATQVWIREYRKYANITGAYLLNDHRSWIEGVYHWSRLFAFYKLW
ncbi:Patched domain-containing protein 3 [Dirofilaria immitis]|nr:Patched domain-containing protein 3 [Dirofilaria immitis]